MVLREDTLQLTPRVDLAGQHMSLDSFFYSLAEEKKSQAIGVMLSGNGTDGTLGLKAIKTAGGVNFAQDSTAKFESMPRSAEAAGCIDFILPPRKIAEELNRI